MTLIEVRAKSTRAIPFMRIPFSKQELLKLFLVCALPINFWALIVWFRSFGSVAEELGQWDAIGVGAYILLFALVEILVVFIVLVLLSLLIPKKWRQEKTIAQVSALYLMVPIGLILDQTRDLITFPREGFIWQAVNSLNNILSSSQVILLVIGSAVAIGLVVAIHRFERVHSLVSAGIDKLVVLSGIYLVLNLAAIIIVIIRNI